MWCTSIIPTPQRKWNCDKFQTSQELHSFWDSVSENMFFHQSTFTENSTITTWKNEEPKNLLITTLYTPNHIHFGLFLKTTEQPLQGSRHATVKSERCVTDNALELNCGCWHLSTPQVVHLADQSLGKFKAGIHWICYSHWATLQSHRCLHPQRSYSSVAVHKAGWRNHTQDF